MISVQAVVDVTVIGDDDGATVSGNGSRIAVAGTIADFKSAGGTRLVSVDLVKGGKLFGKGSINRDGRTVRFLTNKRSIPTEWSSTSGLLEKCLFGRGIDQPTDLQPLRSLKVLDGCFGQGSKLAVKIQTG